MKNTEFYKGTNQLRIAVPVSPIFVLPIKVGSPDKIPISVHLVKHLRIKHIKSARFDIVTISLSIKYSKHPQVRTYIFSS